MPTRFFDDPDQTVPQMLEALARTRPVRVSGAGSGVMAVVRADLDPRQVAVVSGGGSGHEPAHAGLVGEGLLAAAVCGDFFASPSVEAVLSVVREVTGPAGCLLVVKNYTGDRLNFGLAAERARAEGLEVEVVVVADDVALPDNPQPRGLAGTVLVHKVAGHHARRGADLATVAAAARRTAGDCLTLSLALSSALLPGQSGERRSAELGLGIHNETGARDVDPSGADDAVGLVLDALLPVVDERHGADAPLVVLLNDTGGCTTQELAVLATDVLRALGRRARLLVGPAPLMTSVDMHGFSLTLLPYDDELAAALLEPVVPADWPGASPVAEPVTFAPQHSAEPDWGAGERDEAVGTGLRAAATALLDARERLDELDAAVGDGDAGATIGRGARAVAETLDADRLSTGSPALLCRELAALVEQSMGGSSGVVLSILLTATAGGLEDGDDVTAALRAGLERVRVHGDAEVGGRTMVDALSPATDALPEGLDAAARAAREGADGTAEVTTTGVGRSSYLRAEVLRGVVDPGAEAVATGLEAWAASRG